MFCVHPYFSVLLILFTSAFHTEAVRQAFCTKVGSNQLTLDNLDILYPFFGDHENTLERMTREENLKKFKPICGDSCLKLNTANQTCRIHLRRRFVNVLCKLNAYFNNRLCRYPGLEKPFLNYKDGHFDPWNQMLYTTSCLLMCLACAGVPGSKDVLYRICPDPCRLQRACSYTNCTQTGVMEHEFVCKCQEPKERWDPEVKQCIPAYIYQLRRSPPEPFNDLCNMSNCNPDGTLTCFGTNQGISCICKSHYEGLLCTELKDACRTRIQHPHQPNGGLLAAGDIACNTGSGGNKCFSTVSPEGYLSYKCTCNISSWMPNPELPYDNCQRKASACDSIVCVKGRCITDRMGTTPNCLCSPGYGGKACTYWVGVWSEWSPWDRCRPACGGPRYSVRTRDCLSMNESSLFPRDCVGSAIEYAACDDHPCSNMEVSFMEAYFALRQLTMVKSIAVAIIMCLITTFLWWFFFRTALSKLIQHTMRLAVAVFGNRPQNEDEE
ncbi:unnamed protein product [Calicophoron daubneyi]|uniref:EGF-like domain-containing protein n=1 Tax=Calicophoron daubneyi TaxID=300641 RepID=A0AAV2TAX2_CALDB